MNIKLSKAQNELLVSVLDRPMYVASYYSPAKKLVELGLATWTGKGLDHLLATEAGKKQVQATP
jgi:hypothetical protein